MKISEFSLPERRGTLVTLITKSFIMKKGVLLGLMPDDILLMEFETEGCIMGLLETEYSDIMEIF